MYVVMLKFADNRGQAPQHMDGHKAWLKRGFDDGVFLVAGSLGEGTGGAVLAHNTSLADLQARVDADPFVAERVVTAEIVGIAPSRVDQRLDFLMQ
ncbi:uncharacterized protein YciI [Pseudoduganella flava]|uniref:Uncharacterized protein YciI n=1 Tax=Pseudoduganella flava TaxID=871742 RepID=A0A562PR61_9BURK|nr:hypothetical protein [Pseudoduganella flava]QGZ37749.1 hypothetical protein GO485_00870 [Pseudoduganella flava]TWI46556.1 uncharacterized protein YciI [Pseudoduganella flava]